FDTVGTPVVFSEREFTLKHPRPGWAEQDPDEWWSCLVAAVKGAMDESGVRPEEISGISVDAASSTVLAMDERDRHLRPAIMWMDVRSSEQADRIAGTGNNALKYNGFGPVSAEWGLPKALWIKDNEPDVYERAARVCDCGDWLIHRLTGEWTSSINMASSKYYYDRDEGGYPESLYEAVGAGDLLEKFPNDVLDLGTVAGGLRKEVAEEFGLKAGTPVAEGGVDAYVGALGLGVVEPGKMALITGSSHVMIGQTSEPIHDPGFWGAYTDAMIPGQYTVEAGQTSTGSIVAWFKNQFAGDAAAEARERGVDTYEVLTEWAREVPIGSDGLVVLDYFQGNRSPYTDPLARGMMWGLTLSHTPGHVFRAIIEGICYGTENILRTMRGQDFEPRLNVVSGGPAKSDLWMQMHADVSNVPIAFTRVSEGPVLGSAMLAAIGAEIYPDIQTAAENMVHTADTIEPDQERHEEYRFYLDRYMETYPQMKELMHKTERHVAGGGAAERES
ncbi:MAG: FGGY-family carbohydrate kinase, partial [Rubrobacter sp.]